MANGTPPPRAFICYRTEDTGPTASRLAHDLKKRFGKDAVFLDHTNIPAGANWRERLLAEVRAARVVLVLVGKTWLTVRDPKTGRPCLEMPEDWVRQEVEQALDAGRDIITVLVDGARPLTREDLSAVPSIAPLADRQHLDLRRKDWDSDLRRIEKALVSRGFRRLPPWAWRAVAAAGCVLVLGGYAVWHSLPDPASPPPSLPAVVEPPAPPPRPAAKSVHHLEGQVMVRPLFAADFKARHNRFTIEAHDRTAARLPLGEAPLTEDGAFSIPANFPDDAPIEAALTWKRSPADRFVLWSVQHLLKGPPFDGYQFHRLDDLYVQERDAAVREIRDGDFEGADRRLRRLMQLLATYNDPQQVVFGSDSMGTLGFKLMQQICDAAAKYRAKVGRSKVSDPMLEIEQQWRREQLAAAQETPRAAQDLAQALNAWAEFSRQSYSRQQRAWPDRPVFANPDDLLHSRTYETWLREDLDAVRTSLKWWRDHMPGHLGAQHRQVLDQAVEGNADDLRMSHLVDMINTLANPGTGRR